MLYTVEIIIIPLKLQLISMFLLHSGRRICMLKKNTELDSEVKYSRFFFFRNIYRSGFDLVKPMQFYV